MLAVAIFLFNSWGRYLFISKAQFTYQNCSLHKCFKKLCITAVLKSCAKPKCQLKGTNFEIWNTINRKISFIRELWKICAECLWKSQPLTEFGVLILIFAQTSGSDVRFYEFFVVSKNLEVIFVIAKEQFWGMYSKIRTFSIFFFCIMTKNSRFFGLFAKNLGQWPVNDLKRKQTKFGIFTAIKQLRPKKSKNFWNVIK